MKSTVAGIALIFASVITAVVVALAMGGLSLTAAVLSLAVGTGTAVIAWRTCRDTPKKHPGPWDWAMLAVFTLVSLRAFLWLIGERGDEVFILSPNNLGDMSLHLNFIRYFASGIPFWPESPILTGAPLTYPLGADLFNSLLELCGVGTYRGLVWVGLVGAGLTGFMLWRWGGAFGIAAFLFNGGLAGFVLLTTGQLEDFQTELVWKNLFLSMFVTQRGLLCALPAGLLLLLAWRGEFFRREPPLLPRWLQVMLYAGMPLFSLHTFIFLSAILPVIFFAQKTSRRALAILAGAAFVPATLAVLLVTGSFHSSGGLHLAFGWILNGKGWVAFLKDLGLTLPLGLAAGVMAWRGKDAEARCFTGAAIGIFILCLIVAFSKWEWDNMKLMMWSWLVIAPYLWSGVLRPLPMAPRIALCFVLFFSGAVSLIGGLDARHGYSLASRSELAAWQKAIAEIPPGVRFAAMPDYNHPLILLGRKVACGYDGHLWSHGLEYGEKMTLLKSSLAGTIPWKQSAPTLRVEWVAIRKTDQPDAVKEGLGSLYDLRPLLKPAPDNPELPPLQPQPVGLSW